MTSVREILRRRLQRKTVLTPREAHERAREELFAIREMFDSVLDRDDPEDTRYRGRTRAQWVEALAAARRREEQLWLCIANWPPAKGQWGPNGRR